MIRTLVRQYLREERVLRFVRPATSLEVCRKQTLTWDPPCVVAVLLRRVRAAQPAGRHGAGALNLAKIGPQLLRGKKGEKRGRSGLRERKF